MERKGDWLCISIPKMWGHQTVYHILSKEIGASKALISRWNKASAIRKNQQRADVNHQLKEGDLLYLHLFKEEDFGVIPEYHQLDVLYEDDHLLIVNKQAGYDTHPNAPNQTGTLANAVAYHYQMNGLKIKVRHIHRLDKDTSGAIIFAKHELAHSLLDQALEQRRIKRTYKAIVEGILPHQKGMISKPIGKDRHHATRRRVSPTGQKAITHYEVERYIKARNLSIVALQLDTGRTHQIRVHLSSIGHPIIGDTLYGGKRRNGLTRQALHATNVSLIHPLSSKKITVQATFPDDMKSIIEW